MPRKNLNARKVHRGPSTSSWFESLGYVTKRQKIRARRMRSAIGGRYREQAA